MFIEQNGLQGVRLSRSGWAIKVVGRFVALRPVMVHLAVTRQITTLHVVAYLDDSLTFRTPLPMGLHCQVPLRSGTEEVKDSLALATSVTPCMLPSGTPGSGETTNLTT